jgi:hypothetical protein
MEKHIQLVGILNIAYRSMLVLVSLLLLVIAAGFRRFLDVILRLGSVDIQDVPYELLDIVPVVLLVIALLMFVVSVVGIIAGAGVLGRRKWGRVLMLVISFFNLLRIPVGTILGGYSIWVLLNDETIRLFDAPRTSV